MKISFISNWGDWPQPNIGLTYLLSSIEDQHKVGLIDTAFHQKYLLKYIRMEINKQKPEVIGFSTNSFNFKRNLSIAEELKKEYTHILMLWGGIHSTLFPEQVIRYSAVDALCIGEGEITLNEYLDKIENNKKLKVKGLWYKSKGKIFKNSLRPYNQKIDTLPFPNWSYWDIKKYMRIRNPFLGYISLLASRGCPFNCTFCSNSALRKAVPDKFYRVRSAVNVIDEIKSDKDKYWKAGFRIIEFNDETFGLDRKQFIEFCSLYRKEKLHEEIPWISNGTRADIITKEWARLARGAGCLKISLGIETGDNYIRNKVYNKKLTNNQIRKATKNLRNNNIKYDFLMMDGGPWETKKTIQKSNEMIKKLKPFIVHTCHFTPLPKTKLGEKTGINFNSKEFVKGYDWPWFSEDFLGYKEKIKFKMWRMKNNIKVMLEYNKYKSSF